ncbi:MAG: ABC transporter ATP-binding protein [Nitrospinae bacterium]|nr:ABC transporter ATP-binding protein [Nitrospinota bacterium]
MNQSEIKELPAIALYKKVIVFVKPYFAKLVFAMLAMAVVAACTAAAAWIVQPVLDDIFISKNAEMLKVLPFAVLAIYATKGVFKYISSFLMIYIGQTVVRDIRTLLFSHIKLQSLRFFHDHPTGLLMSRVTNDVGVVQNSVSKVLADLVLEILTMFALIFVIFYRDTQLATYAILVLPFSFYFLSIVGKKLRKLSKVGQEKIADMTIVLNETISGVKIVKAFSMEKYETNRFSEENDKFLAIQRKTTKYNEMTAPIMEFLGAIGIAIIIWYGGSQVIEGNTTPGNFFSFMTALMMLYAPIRKLSRINNTIQAALAAFERIFEIIDTEPEIKDNKDAVDIKEFKNEISFENVQFSYTPETQVIKEFTFTVKQGEIIAIVGHSGSGKSTLVDLIPRFYDVTGGSIKIDNRDIRAYTLDSLRGLIGIVTQDCFLFNDSIKNNICYGHRDASDESIIKAAQDAHAHHFIEEMPNGYDSMIGEKGVKLSGGQKQRIAIARALIKNPPILILDEATSALDTKSERIVQEALNTLMQHRTTFVIAHRLSTIVNADKIIVMEKGEIIETGSHEELIARGKAYSNLYNAQFRD